MEMTEAQKAQRAAENEAGKTAGGQATPQKIENAQNAATAELESREKALADAKAANEQCMKDLKSAEAAAKAAEDAAAQAQERQDAYDAKMAEVAAAEAQQKANQRIAMEYNEKIRKEADKWFFPSKSKQEEWGRQQDFYNKRALNANKEKNRLKDEAAGMEPSAEDKSLMAERDKAQQAASDKAAECEKAKAAVDAAKKNLDDLGYNRADIDNFVKVAASEKNTAAKYNVASYGNRNERSENTIFDLRNLNGANFRQNDPNAIKVSLASGAEGQRLSPSKSYYMNQDYLFTNSLASPIPLGSVNRASFPEIQTLILNEFQPYDMLSVADLLPGAVDLLVGITNKAANLAGGFVVNAAKNAIINSNIDKYSKKPDELYNGSLSKRKNGERSYFTADPVQQVENMFNGGKWLNTYELPFYGANYLNGQYSGNWSIGGVKESFGSIGGMMEQMGIDFPSNPKFKISMDKAANRKVSTEFYLINSNSSWLRRNFEFIHAIYAGTSWLHMKYCSIRPPNIYHVLCPGRFQMIWAAMDIEITFVGKLRKNTKVSNELKGMGINSIDEDMLWPDAWKVKIDIRDLTPNNFNMYADYYLQGFNSDEILSLEHQIDMVEMLNDLTSYISGIWDDTISEAKNMATKMKDSTQKIIDSVKDKMDRAAHAGDNETEEQLQKRRKKEEKRS